MRIITFILFFLFFISCSKKTDNKVFSNDDIRVKTFTIIKPTIQSSTPNMSYIEISKNWQTKTVCEYKTYGINNIEVKFVNKNIQIKPLDEQTSNLLQNARKINTMAFGYSINIEKFEIE